MRDRLKVFALGLSIAALSLASAECIYGVLLRAKGPRPEIEDIRIPPHVGGRIGPGPLWLPRKSFRFSRRIKGGKIFWDLQCRIDEFYRRDTPGERTKPHAERFLLLLGDSFVFGDGVGQSETMAAYLGRELPWARAYNYGIGGLFPGELLERMRLIKGPPEIRESRGTVLYFFADSHIMRNMGSFTSVAGWGHGRPYYHVNPEGQIMAERYIEQARPVWTFMARLFTRSHIVRYYNLDWPVQPADSDWRFMLRLLEQIRDTTRRFGADRFYVVFYPGNARMSRAFIPYLEKADIPYIDISHWDMNRLIQGPAFIPGKGHPTAQTHRLLAGALAKVLREDRLTPSGWKHPRRLISTPP